MPTLFRPLVLVCLLIACSSTSSSDEDPSPQQDQDVSDASLTDSETQLCAIGSAECLDERTLGVCEDPSIGLSEVSCGEGLCQVVNGIAMCDEIVCVAGERACNGPETVVECNQAGTGFRFIESCQGQSTGRQCDQGECIPLCILNEKTRTNVGCDYWAADLDNAFVPGGDGFINASRAPFAVVVSNPNETLTAEVSIYNHEGVSLDAEDQRAIRTVPPLGLEVFYLPHRDIESTSITPKAYRIRSSIPIVAYQFNPLDNEEVFSNDASLLLPSHVLGKDYFVMTREQSFERLRGFLTVIAVSDEPTQVTVTVTAETQQLTGTIPPLLPGDSFTTVLNKFDVLNIETGAPGADLTGSRIAASENVVVFGGSEAANVPNTNHCIFPQPELENGVCEYDYRNCLKGDANLDGENENIGCDQQFENCSRNVEAECAASPDPATCRDGGLATCQTDRLDCRLVCYESSVVCSTNYDCNQANFNTCCADHLEQQLFPIHAWGRQYVAAKSYARGNELDYWRVIASQDDTKVETVPPQTVIPTLNAGEWFEFGTAADFELISDKPVMLGQFLASEHAPNPNLRDRLEPGDAATGDPAFILAVPVEQFRTDFVFLAPDKYAFDYVTVIAPIGAEVFFDDLPLESVASWEPLGDPASWQVARFQIADGTHFIQGDAPLGITVYGYDQYVSYGYPGGLNLDVVDPETGEAIPQPESEEGEN